MTDYRILTYIHHSDRWLNEDGWDISITPHLDFTTGVVYIQIHGCERDMEFDGQMLPVTITSEWVRLDSHTPPNATTWDITTWEGRRVNRPQCLTPVRSRIIKPQYRSLDDDAQLAHAPYLQHELLLPKTA